MTLQLKGITRLCSDDPRDLYELELYGYDSPAPRLMFAVSAPLVCTEDGRRDLYVTVFSENTWKHSATVDKAQADIAITALAQGMNDGFDLLDIERLPARICSINSLQIYETELYLGVSLRGWVPAEFLRKLADVLELCVHPVETPEGVVPDAA